MKYIERLTTDLTGWESVFIWQDDRFDYAVLIIPQQMPPVSLKNVAPYHSRFLG